MNDVPTLIVSDLDEERTLVDPRFARRSVIAAVEPSDRRIPAPKRRIPQVMQFLASTRVLLAIAVLGLAWVAYQQWKTANTLGEAMEAMVAANHRPAPFQAIEPASPSPSQSASPPSNDETALEPSVPEREAMERQAVRWFASNDFTRALSQYEALSGQFPEFSPYRDAAAVLRAKLSCARLSASAHGACP